MLMINERLQLQLYDNIIYIVSKFKSSIVLYKSEKNSIKKNKGVENVYKKL